MNQQDEAAHGAVSTADGIARCPQLAKCLDYMTDLGAGRDESRRKAQLLES